MQLKISYFLYCQKKVIFFCLFFLIWYYIFIYRQKQFCVIAMKRFVNSKDTGAPCQRCMILRIFLGMVLFVVILGLAGGSELSYLKYVTTQKVANGIMIFGFIVFLFKLIFWYWDKKKENISE